MTLEAMTQYVKYLLDQRTNLEYTVFTLQKEINDLKQSISTEGQDKAEGS